MEKKILVVDDDEMNRDMLTWMLEDKYSIIEACNGIETLEIIKQEGTDLEALLLDINMPEMNGYEVLQELAKSDFMEKVPVLIITGERAETERRCFEFPIADFINKPFDGNIVKRRVENNVELFNYKGFLETRVEEQTAEIRKQNLELLKQAQRLRDTNDNIISLLGDVVEARNMESGEHIRRVKAYTKILIEDMANRYPEYGITEDEIRLIAAASPLHDVGKIMIPDNVLLKPGRLTDEEFEIIKGHTVKGCEILENAQHMWDDEYYRYSYDICRSHHERYDGRGYPDGLSGDDIPISAQVVSLADVYDALVTERVYKKPFSLDKAFEMITNNECGVFNPKLMECFRACREAMEFFTKNS